MSYVRSSENYDFVDNVENSKIQKTKFYEITFSSRSGLNHVRFGRNFVQNFPRGEPDRFLRVWGAESFDLYEFFEIFVTIF